jgi:hypothetical protein
VSKSKYTLGQSGRGLVVVGSFAGVVEPGQVERLARDNRVEVRVLFGALRRRPRMAGSCRCPSVHFSAPMANNPDAARVGQ